MKKWIWISLVLGAGFSAMAEVNSSPSEIDRQLSLLRAREQGVDSVIVVFKEALPEMPVGALADGEEAPSLFSSVGSLQKVMKRSTDTLSAPLSEGGTAPGLSRAARNLRNMYTATISADSEMEEVLDEISASPLVEYVEPNYRVYPLAMPNDTHFAQEQWSLNNTGQVYHVGSTPTATTTGTPGADIGWLSSWESPDFPTNEILIAVVDTGVDYTHRDLTNQMWRNPGEAGALATNGVDDDLNGYIDDVYGIDALNTDSDPMDDHYHGTHVAGTIAAQTDNGYGIAGICPSAKIMACKFLGNSGGSSAGGIACIQYAVDMGAKIINNSWGGGAYLQSLQDVITYANEQGVVVLCASGNDNSGITMFPAGYKGSLAVSASDAKDERAYFSNYGAHVDVSAPGVSILSLLTHLGDPSHGRFDNDFLIISGTSMACPTAAGAMGLLMNKRPGHEPWIYEKVMEKTCDTNFYSIPANTNYLGSLGAGRIQTPELLDFDGTNAFLEAYFQLRTGFGRSFLSPGEATNLVVRAGTWSQDVSDLSVHVTALTTGITVNVDSYEIGDLPSATSTNLPVDTFVVEVKTNVAWNSIQKVRVEIRSGDTVLDEEVHGFQVFSGQVMEMIPYDLDGDGSKEIVATYFNTVMAFDASGKMKWVHSLGDYYGVNFAPAVGDVDGDGKGEVVITAQKRFFGPPSHQELYVFEHDGMLNTNIWPMNIKTNIGYWNVNPPALADMDGDDDLDIILTGAIGSHARFGVVDEDGDFIGYRTGTISNSLCIPKWPAVGDINGNGSNEIVSIVQTAEAMDPSNTATIVVLNGACEELFTIPIEGDDVFFHYPPTLADVDFDGDSEFVVAGNIDGSDYLVVYKQDGSIMPGFPKLMNNTGGLIHAPVVADMDDDGDLEIFLFRSDTRQILGFDHQGNVLPHFPINDPNIAAETFANGFSPVVADVNGDGVPDILYAGNYQRAPDDSYTYQLTARDLDGLLLPEYPITLSGEDGLYTAVYRVTLDALGGGTFGTNQYIITSIGSELHILDTGYQFNENQQHWPMNTQNGQRTYNYETRGDSLRGNLICTNRNGVNDLTAEFSSFYVEAGTGAVFYSWDFDNDGTAEAEGFGLDRTSHYYSSTGTYSVALTFSNEAGEVYSVTQEDFITVYSDLAADFSQINPTGSLTAPIRIEFEDTSSNFAQYWAWDFGDTGENSLQAPNNVVGDSGDSWVLEGATPGELNIGQNNGDFLIDANYPLIAAIGHQTVQEGETLEFQVVATDADGDLLQWVNINKPDSTTFSTDGGTGTFTWVAASPGGFYEAEFVALDSTGLESTQTVTISVLPKTLLTVSEVMHTPSTSGDEGEWFELYNLGKTAVDINGWIITGSGSDFHVINAGGALNVPAKDFIVLGRNADTNLNGGVVVDYVYTSNTFSSTDRVILQDGTSNEMVRANWFNGAAGASSYLEDSQSNPFETWRWRISSNVWSGSQGDAGSPGAANETGNWPANYTPLLASIGHKTVVESNSLEFAVYGVDLFDGDEISLSVSNLPAGAVFNTVTNAGQVTNLFSWADPSPAGVYTMTFYAADSSSVTSETVTISVDPAWSVPAIKAFVNEVRADGRGIDRNDFIEILAPTGTDLAGCFLTHHDGGSSDGEIWRFTFPAFTVQDDGLTNALGQALGFAVLSQSNAPVAGADFMLPAELKNRESGVILYDVYTNVLDAVAWGVAGDLVDDDPSNTVSRSVSSSDRDYLHVTQADDGSTESYSENAAFVFPTSGTFTVTLTVGNEFGETDTIQKTVILDDYVGSADTHYVWKGGKHWYPYKSWEEAATNIASALDAANDGDTVVVTNGIYMEKPEDDTLRIKKGITLQSVNGPHATILDGDGDEMGILLMHSNAVFEGFTLQNCHGMISPLYVYDGALARNLIIRDNDIFFNTAGANIRDTGSVLADSLIISNQSTVEAGLSLVGGGMASNCIVRGNRTSGETAASGAWVSSATMYNCLVAENVGGRSAVELVSSEIYNSTLVNNEITETPGGALFFNSVGSSCLMENTISYSNSGGNWAFEDMGQTDRDTIINSCTTPAITHLISSNVTALITDDPEFVDFSGENYRLSSNSPCRDAGNNMHTSNLLYSKTYLFDFGDPSTTTTGNWNNVTDVSAGLRLSNAIDTNGLASDMSLTFLKNFLSIDTSGIETSTVYEASAQRDSFSSTNFYENFGEVFQLGGLNPSNRYSFKFFASETYSSNNSARTYFYGPTQDAPMLFTYSNITRAVGVDMESPNASSNIAVMIDHNPNYAAYLGVMEITEYEYQFSTVLTNQLDLDSNPRVHNEVVDIGAYEWTTNDTPQVSLAATPTEGSIDLQVSFTATASDIDGTITNYAWDFGDGTIVAGSALTNPDHTYSNSGTYGASVIVTDNSGKTATAGLSVFANPNTPSAPTNFVAANHSPSQNNLSWTDTSGDETEFIIHRRIVTNAAEIVIDDADANAEFDQGNAPTSWKTTTKADAYNNSCHYRDYAPLYPGDYTASFRPALSEPGLYEIFEWHPADATAAAATPVRIYHKTGIVELFVDQTVNGGQWNSLGIHDLTVEGYVKIQPSWVGDRVYADAIKFVRTEPYQPLTTLSENSTNHPDTGLTDDRTYEYRIASANEQGLSDWVEAQTYIPSTNLLPTASIDSLNPTSGSPDLAVSAIGSATDSDGTITHYLWNFGDGYSGSIQSGTTLTNASYVYRNIGIYDLTLTVTDNLGYSDTVTNSVNVYGAIPNAPTALQAQNVSDLYVEVTWIDNAYNEDRLVLQRQTEGGAFSNLAVLGETVETYNDSDVAFSTTYGYRVRAENANGTSDWSNVASIPFGDEANFTLPFTEPFEATNITTGTIAGQHGWAGNGTVQTGTVHEGSQALSITEGTATHGFLGEASNVWITLWAQPVISEEAPEINSNAAAAFYINASSNLVAYSNTTPIEIVGATFSNGWNKIEVSCDFVSKVWNLSLNNVPRVGNFAFYGSPASFQALEISEGSTNTLFIDSITVTDSEDDSDSDGLPDTWEEDNFGDLDANPGDAAANPDYTVMDCYIAGLDPTDENAVFNVSNDWNTLSWNATNGRVYSVYWTSNLLSGFQSLESNLSWTAMPYTDTNHPGQEKGFYKIDVELE